MPEPEDLKNMLARIQEYEVGARQLSGNLRILAAWEMDGGDEDKVRKLLGEVVTQSKSLSLLQTTLIEDLSHLLKER